MIFIDEQLMMNIVIFHKLRLRICQLHGYSMLYQ